MRYLDISLCHPPSSAVCHASAVESMSATIRVYLGVKAQRWKVEPSSTVGDLVELVGPCASFLHCIGAISLRYACMHSGLCQEGIIYVRAAVV